VVQKTLTALIACLALAGTAAAADTPTFSKDVAPILYKNCVVCHRPGEVAPMSLITYQNARPWARAIKNKVVAREMPPWGASADSLKMANDRSLPAKDVETIVKWADAGAPKGEDKDLPAAPTFPDGVTLGVVTSPAAVKKVPSCPPVGPPIRSPTRSLASVSPRQRAINPRGRDTAEANLPRTVLFLSMVSVAGLSVPIKSPAQPTKTLGGKGSGVKVTDSPRS
jgi:hypothetical protein